MMMRRAVTLTFLAAAGFHPVEALVPGHQPSLAPGGVARTASRPPRLVRRGAGKLDPELDATTRKFGLEGGLFSIFKSEGGEDKGAQAKALLKEYGAAYLVTSISLAIVSFAICYALVDAGIDVAALLAKVNIDATATAEKAGTVAIAYAAHKAASPIRFPPTVALTPVVAKLLKKDKAE